MKNRKKNSMKEKKIHSIKMIQIAYPMKLKRWIPVLMALFLWVGCTREVIVEVPVYVEKESAVKFTLYTTTFSNRAAQDHYGTFPLEAERRIFNYAILIFNVDNKLEAALIANPYDPAVPGSTGLDTDGYLPLYFTDENGEETVVTLTSGQKKIFALVNAPQPLWDEWVAMMPDEGKTLENYQAYTLDVKSKGGLNYITGTSATPAGDERGFLMTSSDIETIYLEPTLENAVNIEVRVGRAMAKASVASSLQVNPRNLEQQPNGELSDISYKIKNNPNEMYIIPSITDGYTYTPYFYTNSNPASLYFDSPGTLAGNYVPVSKQNALTQLYCMENGNRNPNSENVTRVVIKGTYTPDVLYKANGEDIFTGYHTGDDFWRIAEIVDGQRIYTDKYYGENPSAYLKEEQRLVHYINGETYYFLYLDRDEKEYAYPHNYTVKRNSYYNIDITKVSNAGEETENPGVDLPGPEPSDNSRITVSISIKEWDLIQGNGEL